MEEKITISKKLLEEIKKTNEEILNLLQKANVEDLEKYQDINLKIEDNIKKENCVKRFGEIFEIKNIDIDVTKLPLLKYIIREFGEDLYTPSEKNEKLKKEKTKLQKEFETILTKEQYEKFIKYWELENKATEELEEQLFMYGFIMAKQQDKEVQDVINNGLLE